MFKEAMSDFMVGVLLKHAEAMRDLLVSLNSRLHSQQRVTRSRRAAPFDSGGVNCRKSEVAQTGNCDAGF